MMEKIENRSFFIVGNSRSGTTMMMRVLNAHREIHSINEPHFFENMWSPADQGTLLEKEDAVALLEKLFTVQRDGFFAKVKVGSYGSEIDTILKQLGEENWTRLKVYQAYLHFETRANGKTFPCEKTPQNVFYLYELLTQIDDSKIINMVRDPRAVLLSQKRKWKRKFLGGSFLTYREMLRLMINYHPLTIGRLWNSSVGAAWKYAKHPDILHLRFEDLLSSPKETVTNVCDFLDIEFHDEMLDIPYAGSSSIADDHSSRGIRTARADSWKGKLSRTEVFICQLVCRKYMKLWATNLLKCFQIHFEFYGTSSSSRSNSYLRLWQTWDACGA